MLLKLLNLPFGRGVKFAAGLLNVSDVLSKYSSHNLVKLSNNLVIAQLYAGRRYDHRIYPKVEEEEDVRGYPERDHIRKSRFNQSHHSENYNSEWQKPRNMDRSEVGSQWKETIDVVDEAAGNFNNFSISDVTQSKLQALGIKFLFSSQTSTYNPIFDGKDVIVQARTGSGKTLSYALPIVERLQSDANKANTRNPRMLVLTPTRELARQVAEVIASISDRLSVVSVYGGAPIASQERMLRAGADVIVGTPGRIADFIERKTLNLHDLQHVVLDEVDRMLDMGFSVSVDEILSHRYIRGKPEQNPQTLLFSATVPSWVQKMAQKYLQEDIVKIDLVGRGNVRTATSVKHLAVQCHPASRSKVIAETLQVYSGIHGRAIIFCSTKLEADRLATSEDIRTETHVLHGDIPQDKREMVLKGFKDGRYQCLIATDVAARGLDIPEVDLVIQCSPPKDVDSYIHRAGRTGRAGRSGVSLVIYTPYEQQDLYTVEKVAGLKFERIQPPTAEASAAAATEDALKSLEAVSVSITDRFTAVAETVAAKHGATKALAAAIAVMSGHARPKSLLTSESGFTTYIYQTESQEFNSVGQALRSLQLSDLTRQIGKAVLFADRKGCAFDLRSKHDQSIVEQWTNTSSETLSVATELPPLLTPSYSDRPQTSSSYYGQKGNRQFDGYRRSKSFKPRFNRDRTTNNDLFRSNDRRGISDNEY